MENIKLNLMKVDTPSSHIQSLPAALGFQPENKAVFTVCNESEATEIHIWEVPVNWVEALEEIRNSYSGSSLSGILVVYSQKAQDSPGKSNSSNLAGVISCHKRVLP